MENEVHRLRFQDIRLVPPPECAPFLFETDQDRYARLRTEPNLTRTRPATITHQPRNRD